MQSEGKVRRAPGAPFLPKSKRIEPPSTLAPGKGGGRIMLEFRGDKLSGHGIRPPPQVEVAAHSSRLLNARPGMGHPESAPRLLMENGSRVRVVMARRSPDIVKLASRRRWVGWLLSVGVAAYPCSFVMQLMTMRSGGSLASAIALAILLVLLGSWAVTTLIGILLMLADNWHPLVIVPVAVLLLAPCLNSMSLYLIDAVVVRSLRRAGVRVGFFGPSAAACRWLRDPDLCTGCGYDLSGNTSGRCPECGRSIAPARCPHCDFEPAGRLHSICPACRKRVDPTFCSGCAIEITGSNRDTCEDCAISVLRAP